MLRQQEQEDQFRLNLNTLVHLNNFVFLVFSYCTRQVHIQSQCLDESGDTFINWVFYGNLIIYITLIVVVFLLKIKLLDKCLIKCGAVCVSIQAYGFFAAVLLFDIMTMIYGINQYFIQDPSTCNEINLFTMVCAYIFTVWIIIAVIGILYKIWYKCQPPQEDYRKILNPNTNVY